MRVLRGIVALFDAVIGPLVAAVAHLLVAVTVLLAATWPFGPRSGHGKERAYPYLLAMRSELHSIAMAQEAHYQEHARYATVLSPDDFRNSTGVLVVSMNVEPMGFVAVVEYPAGTTRRCRIRYRRGEEGEPSCDK